MRGSRPLPKNRCCSSGHAPLAWMYVPAETNAQAVKELLVTFLQVGQIPLESFGFFTPRPFEALLRSTLSGFSFEFLQFLTLFTRRADVARPLLTSVFLVWTMRPHRKHSLSASPPSLPPLDLSRWRSVQLPVVTFNELIASRFTVTDITVRIYHHHQKHNHGYGC